MTAAGVSTQRRFRTVLLETRGKASLRSFLAENAVRDDEALAELIEIDGRTRLELGLEVDLQAYLDAIPDLERRPVVLDAAIDMALRARSGRSKPSEEAIGALVGAHPALAGAIRDAAALASALWLTSETTQRATRYRDTLPCDFGRALPDGSHPYRLLRLIGEGAWGEVYEAIDRRLSAESSENRVAIKVLRSGLPGDWLRDRAAEEAAKARRIDHANVVKVFDRATTPDGEEFIVYQLVEGKDLSSLEPPLDPRQAAALVAKIARGAQAAHSEGLVHCDLKPDNILLTKDGEPRIADFGAAVAVDRVLDEASAAGTLAFMAPEQRRLGRTDFGPPVDVYALGGILFWLLTDRLASGDDAREIERRLSADPRTLSPPSPRRFRPSIDRDLDLVCRRALEPLPGKRHPAAGSLADDLEAWLKREPIGWTRPSIGRVARLWVIRRPMVASLVAVLALVTIAGVYGVAHFAESTRLEAGERRRVEALYAEQEAFRSGMLRIVSATSDALMNARSTSWSGLQLGGTWVYLNMVGAAGFNDPESLVELLDSQRKVLEHSMAGRYEDRTVESIVGRTGLALWQVSDGSYEVALPLLARLEEDCAAVLPAGDPWLARVHALRLCAQADRLMEEACVFEEPGPREAAIALCAEIEAVAARARRTLDSGPIAAQCLRRVQALCEPERLNDRWRAGAAAVYLHDLRKFLSMPE